MGRNSQRCSSFTRYFFQIKGRRRTDDRWYPRVYRSYLLVNRLDLGPDDSLEATGLARLRRAGWSLGQWSVYTDDGGLVWVVSGTNGENAIWAEGATLAEAWGRAVDQARSLGLLAPSVDEAPQGDDEEPLDPRPDPRLG